MPESIRDALESAFDSQEGETENEVIAEDNYSDSDSVPDDLDIREESDESDRLRDEKGRFKSTKEAPEDESAPVDEPTEEVVEEPIDPEIEELLNKRPGSFKSEAVWKKLAYGQANADDQRYLANYYLHREEDFHRGVQHFKSEAEKSHYLSQSVEPYLPILNNQGIDPGQFVKNLAHTHYLLSTTPMEQRIAVLNEAAKQYGINLVATDQGLSLAPMSHNDQLMTQQMAEYKREIDAIKQWRETETRSNIQSEINRLVADRNNFPHFDDLREDMALLLESGHATTFQDAYAEAYRRATRFSPRAPAAPQNQVQRLAKAKATAVSPKSGSPTAPPSKSTRHSLRASLNDAFDQLM